MSTLTLLSCSLFIALGLWQLDRAEEKQAIEDRFIGQLELPYQRLILEQQIDDRFAYRKIKLNGRYDNERILFIDNQLNKGVAGYHVVVPFFIDGGRRAVLVDRGWVVADYDRSVLPNIRPPKNPHQLMGIVTIPSLEGFRMGEVVISESWPQRIPYVDMGKIKQGVDFEVLPYLIWMSPEMDDYYVRDWQPVWLPPEKSRAYAVQWFSFAVVVFIIFIALNMRKLDVPESRD